LDIDRAKLKYKINYNPVTFNFSNKTYENGSEVYSKYEYARANHWKCDKCDFRCTSFRKLKEHKVEQHSY